jgi:peptidoglycan/xylan/chitin deacetylase (PgdA/CDA1 family)
MLDNYINIVMYHFVREKNNKLNSFKFLNIKDFIKQLKFFKKKYNFLQPSEIKYIIKNRINIKKNCIWLTFDDGYKDHYKFVLPILDEHNIKASFFPVVKSSINFEVLDANKIQFLISTLSSSKLLSLIELYFNKNKLFKKYGDFSIFIRSTIIKKRLDTKEVALIKILLQNKFDYSDRKKINFFLFKKYITNDEKNFAKLLYMNLKEIKILKNFGHEIGVHTISHPWLDSLDYKQQEKEILGSINFWKNNRVIKSDATFCYPYGRYNADTIKILKTSPNVSFGITTYSDVYRHQNFNNYEIPRKDTIDYLNLI